MVHWADWAIAGLVLSGDILQVLGEVIAQNLQLRTPKARPTGVRPNMPLRHSHAIGVIDPNSPVVHDDARAHRTSLTGTTPIRNNDARVLTGREHA